MLPFAMSPVKSARQSSRKYGVLKPMRLFSLFGLLLFSVVLSAFEAKAEDVVPAGPPAALLEAGDLIWPKQPHTVIAYNLKPGNSEQIAARWRQEKDTYLNQLRAKQELPQKERERYKLLKNMTYKRFASYYLEDVPLGEPTQFGAGFSVGHVGIVQIVEGTPYVVEALWGPGVRRISYSDWLQEHSGDLFWLARLKDVSAEKRALVAKKAAEQIQKPYAFFNFDLAEVSGFYCSKLAWLSILQGAGFAPDDDPNPERLLWYSPKQLMKSKHVMFLVNPGDYGSK